MSDGIEVFIVLLFAIALFSILNFLAISLSGHSFKKNRGRFHIFTTDSHYLLTIATFASIFDKAGFGAGTLAFMIASVYILNGIVILLSSLFMLKKT